MSWDSYLDNLVAYCVDGNGRSHADTGCIIGMNGAKWTSDAHKNALKLTPAEAKTIGDCFSSKNFTNFQEFGVIVESNKYQFLRDIEGRIVMAKKKGLGALTLQKSKTAIVIGHCPEDGQQGQLNKGVGSIAEYLESQNM